MTTATATDRAVARMTVKILEGFGGPGGLSEGMAMLGITDVLGVELNSDACATAEAAGHKRLQADIRHLDPNDYPDVELWVSGPPCQSFAGPGKQSGIAELEKVVKGIQIVSDRPRPYQSEMPTFADPRTALVLETLEFALSLPNVRVVVAEQVPTVRPVWIEMCAELAAFHRFESVNVVTVRADDVGGPTRRARVFLVATRGYTPDLSTLPTRAWWSSGRFELGIVEHLPNLSTAFPRPTMAQALGWPTGVMVNTRGDRKTSGGNLFSADGPTQSLTGRARTWYRTDLGPVDGRLTPSDAGLLQGFRRDYPWSAGGSRTSQFQRVADSVCPMVGAAVIGAALGLPWQDAVWQHLEQLYGPREIRPADPFQLDLFAEVS